jgi:hypothetical protein
MPKIINTPVRYRGLKLNRLNLMGRMRLIEFFPESIIAHQ